MDDNGFGIMVQKICGLNNYLAIIMLPPVVVRQGYLKYQNHFFRNINSLIFCNSTFS